MRKKIFLLTALFALLFSLSACGANAETQTPTKLSLSGVSEASEVDVDLTQISDTVRYAEIYNITMNPQDYEGKTIRMSGQFVEFSYLEGGQSYYAVLVQDAGSCCIQGLEVVLDENSTASYPENDSMVTVVGTLETYESGTIVYSRLRVSDFESDAAGT